MDVGHKVGDVDVDLVCIFRCSVHVDMFIFIPYLMADKTESWTVEHVVASERDGLRALRDELVYQIAQLGR